MFGSSVKQREKASGIRGASSSEMRVLACLLIGRLYGTVDLELTSGRVNVLNGKVKRIASLTSWHSFLKYRIFRIV